MDYSDYTKDPIFGAFSALAFTIGLVVPKAFGAIALLFLSIVYGVLALYRKKGYFGLPLLCMVGAVILLYLHFQEQSWKYDSYDY